MRGTLDENELLNLRRPLRRLWLAAFALAVSSRPAFAQSDADFLAAKGAYDKGDRAKLASLAPKLNGHILQPYVEYWQLKLAIDDAAPQAVRDYLDRYPDTPLAEKLRVDWLKSLAKKSDWNRFALDYPPPSGEDPELACYGVQYRRQRDGDAVLADAKPLWFNGQATPDACEPLFAALIARGDLTVADRWRGFGSPRRPAMCAWRMRLPTICRAARASPSATSLPRTRTSSAR